ncbi:MAG TPA: YncE family protein [Gaiellales bacterium]|jgi:YVTN family beta-propeller protein|nr:YncE family protein [Gaiellales bacterium]
MQPHHRVIRAIAALACAVAVIGTASASASSRKVIGPRAKVIAKIAIPEGTGGLAIGEGAVWALSWSKWTLMRIDPHANAITSRVKLKPVNPCPPAPDTCGSVTAGNGAVWVSMRTDNVVARVDPESSKVTAMIGVGNDPQGVATSPGAVWVANNGAPSVSRIDPATNKVVATIPLGPASACCSDHIGLTTGIGSVWVNIPNLHSVVRIDEATNAVTATITSSLDESDEPCGSAAVSQDAVWVAGAHCGSVITRIDPRTNKPSGKVKGAVSPINVGLGFGSLWVTDLDARSVLRVDTRTRRIIGILPVGGIPVLLSVGLGSIWVRDDAGSVLRIAPRH